MGALVERPTCAVGAPAITVAEADGGGLAVACVTVLATTVAAGSPVASFTSASTIPPTPRGTAFIPPRGCPELGPGATTVGGWAGGTAVVTVVVVVVAVGVGLQRSVVSG